ncbi:MAG: hypothetical protein ABI867_38430 [Kofleriaceae bacterium]
MDQHVGPTGLDDCGSLEAFFGSQDDPAWVAAQTCVQAHLDQRVPFVVRFRTLIIDYGTFLTVYVGREIDGVWTVSMLTEGTTADFETYATQWGCADFRASFPDCGAETDLYRSLCFTCGNAANMLVDRCRVD